MYNLRKVKHFKKLSRKYSIESIAGYYHGRDINSICGVLPGIVFIRDLKDGTFRVDSRSWNLTVKNIRIPESYFRECIADSTYYETIIGDCTIENNITLDLDFDLDLESENESSQCVCNLKLHNGKLTEYRIEVCENNQYGRQEFVDLVKINFSDPLNSTLSKMNELNKQSERKLSALC